MRRYDKRHSREGDCVWSLLIESPSLFWIALAFLIAALGVNGYISTVESRATAPAKIFQDDPPSILLNGDVDHNRDAVLASFVDCRHGNKRAGLPDRRFTTARD